MTDWKIVRGDTKPLVIDTTGSAMVVYERRNIHEVEVKDTTSEEPYKLWEYEEREYTKSEYEQMTSPAICGLQQSLSDVSADIALLEV